MRHKLSNKDKIKLQAEIAELRSDLKTAEGSQAEHLEYMLDERLDLLKAGYFDSYTVERIDY